jgi:hypothetical protein
LTIPQEEIRMRLSIKVIIPGLGVFIFLIGALIPAWAQKPQSRTELDGKVERFLAENRARWQDWNVPYQDGQVLYNLIIKNNYRKALEIGTSTGHSSIWMAWAQGRHRSLNELAEAWLLAQPQVCPVISGSSRFQQVVDNVKVVDWRLTGSDLKEIDALLA